MRTFLAVLFLSALAVFGGSCGNGVDRRLREVDSLRERRDAASTGRLEVLAADPSAQVRAFALSALAETTGDGAAERIAAALDDPESTVRSTAVKLAGERKVVSARDRLGALLRSDGSVEIRRRAAAALGAVGGEVAGTLAGGLADPDPGVREACARALAGIDAAPAEGALLRTMQLDPEPRVRVEAVRALARIDTDAARAGVASAASDPNEFVRTAAAETTRR